MYRFTKNYRMVFVLAGLTIVGAWPSGAVSAGEPPDGSPEPQRQTARAAGPKWGTLRMRFVMDDSKSMQEPDAASLGDSQPSARHGPTGRHAAQAGIRDVVVSLPHVSRIHDMYARDVATSVALIQRDNRFIPHVVPVIVGQELKIQNQDATTHVALIRPWRGPEMNLLVAPGAAVTWRFTHAESLPVAVSCTFHPSMRAYVVVANNPYVAVSDDRGVAFLAGVPAEEKLDMYLWHEHTGPLELPGAERRGHFHAVIPAEGLLDLGDIRISTAVGRNPADAD